VSAGETTIEGLDMLFDETAFVRDVFVHGCHVLACGGGVLPDAKRGIPPLSEKYGRAELLKHCLDLYAVKRTTPLPYLYEGVWFAFRDIIYYMADAETVAYLLSIHRKQSPAFGRASMGAGRCEHTDVSFLIATITKRLGLPLPDGIPPATDEEVQEQLFPCD
jgi:hypothetical protein